MGTKIYVMTSSQDVAVVYRNIEQLTFDEYIRGMMLQFGATPAAVDKMWRKPTSSDFLSSNDLQPNPLLKPLAHLSDGFNRQQLHPGERLDVLQNTFLGNIHKSLTWENMSPKVILSSVPGKESTRTRTVSLIAWTREVLLDGATRAFFGDALLEIDPQLFDSFFAFDDNSWKLTYKIPRPWSTEMYASKQKAQDALKKYFMLPKDKRPGAAWIIQTLETEMKARGIDESDISAFLMMIYWVFVPAFVKHSRRISLLILFAYSLRYRINGNAYKLCFWILTYMLHDSNLFTSIRNEVVPAVQASTSPNDLSSRLDRCPHLDAIFHEVLRLVSSSSSIRNVQTPITVGGKYLRAGTKVLIPYRQLHFDEDVFGSNAQSFDAERFLRNKDLVKSSSYRPFGGGTTHCPGRFLARREVLTFVALVVDRFELELAGDVGTSGTAFPKLEDRKPCLGIMGPLTGEDVIVKVREAKR